MDSPWLETGSPFGLRLMSIIVFEWSSFWDGFGTWSEGVDLGVRHV